MYIQLETERLTIRPINLRDASFIIRLVNTEGWIKFIGDRNIKEISDSEKYIQKILDNTKYFYSVFELKTTGQPIGIITFLHRDGYDNPDIGFALLPEFEKKGYSYEAAKKYLDEIFKAKLADKIVAITVPENIGSIKLLQKLGLTFVKNFVENNEKLSLYEITA